MNKSLKKWHLKLIFPHFELLVLFQNRAKSGNLGKVVRFAIRAKPGIVLIEFVLSEDPRYHVGLLIQDCT